jgi:hypothetical protein
VEESGDVDERSRTKGVAVECDGQTAGLDGR